MPITKSRLKMLQDRDAAITAEMRKMSDLLTVEDRLAFTEDEDATFKELQSQSVDVQKSLKIEQDILAQEKRMATIIDGNRHAAETATQNAELPAIPKFPPRIVGRTYNLNHFRGSQKTSREWNEEAYTVGRFFLASVWNHPDSVRWCQEHGLAFQLYEYQDESHQLAQSGISNTAGAILVPDVLSDRIIDLKEERGVFSRFSDRWPMSSDNLTIPRRLSGVTAYFVSDGVATTESQMGWDGVTLSAKEMAAMVRYPNTLNEDAIVSLADKLTGEIAYAFADKEDTSGFTGDGSTTYGGIRGLSNLIDDANHGNSVTTNGATSGGVVIAAAGGTSFGATVLGDYERMVGLLPQYAAAGARWYFSRAGFSAGPQRLMDAAGGNTNATLATGASLQFLGYPVIIAQVLNSTLAAQTSTIVAFFGDLVLASSYGSRREIGIESSMHRYFEFRQVAIQGVQRFDIVNHDLGNTTTAGPIVALKTAAS